VITFENSILISRPPQEIFDYAADPANAHKWQSNMISLEWTSTSVPGVGSTQRGVARFLGRDMVSNVEITVWDPPYQYGYKLVDGPFKLAGSMMFEAKESGTKVTAYGQADARSFFRLAEGLLKKQTEKQNSTNLEALKLLLQG
jgi:hypothetical protein